MIVLALAVTRPLQPPTRPGARLRLAELVPDWAADRSDSRDRGRLERWDDYRQRMEPRKNDAPDSRRHVDDPRADDDDENENDEQQQR